MRLLTGPMWKSWIAMLCVALVAFVTLEQVSPAHAAENAISVSASNELAAANDLAGSQDDDGSSGGEQQQRHHCCGAHTSSGPVLSEAGTPNQYTSLIVLIRSDDNTLARASSGLERPPKATAIV
ncbi:MAG: hypothetical protein R3C30_01240 [Hyphomonadaceae bacterium]